MRLARDTTDPMLAQSLSELAAEYTARAIHIETMALGKDPEDD